VWQKAGPGTCWASCAASCVCTPDQHSAAALSVHCARRRTRATPVAPRQQYCNDAPASAPGKAAAQCDHPRRQRETPGMRPAPALPARHILHFARRQACKAMQHISIKSHVTYDATSQGTHRISGARAGQSGFPGVSRFLPSTVLAWMPCMSWRPWTTYHRSRRPISEPTCVRRGARCQEEVHQPLRAKCTSNER